MPAGHSSCDRQGKDRTLDILITTSGHVILVTVQRSERLGESIQKVEELFREPIHRIREIPDGGPATGSCWLYSRYQTLRFFRIKIPQSLNWAGTGHPFPGPGHDVGEPFWGDRSDGTESEFSPADPFFLGEVWQG